MYDDEKVWAIDLGEDLETVRNDGLQEDATADSGGAGRRSRVVVRRVKPTRAKSRRKPPRRLHFALLLPLVFLSGPFAVLMTPEGRARRFWMILGVLMGFGWIACAAWGPTLAEWFRPGRFQVPALVCAASLVVGGFTAWARGILLAGGENRPADSRLPLPLRRGWGTGLLGLAAPGMGLLAAGRNRRAAAVVWLGCLPALALLFLATGDRWLARPLGATPSPEYEKLLLIAAGILGISVLGYIIQALEGIRLVPWEGYRVGRQRGDLLGLVAVIGVLVFLGAVDPSPVARRLGNQARQMRSEGYRIIPLAMVRTATVLDPGRTDYEVVALQIYEEMGNVERSRAVRRSLERKIASYLEMVGREKEPAAPDAASADPWVWERMDESLLAGPLGGFPPSPFLDAKNPETMVSGLAGHEVAGD